MPTNLVELAKNAAAEKGIADLQEKIQSKLEGAFRAVIKDVSGVFQVDATRQKTWDSFYEALAETFCDLVTLAVSTTINVFAPGAGSITAVVNLDGGGTSNVTLAGSSTGDAFAKAYSDAGWNKVGSQGMSFTKTFTDLVSLRPGSRDFKDLTNLVLPKPEDKIRSYVEQRTFSGYIDHLLSIPVSRSSTSATEGDANLLLLPYVLGYGATNGDALFEDPSFRWFFYANREIGQVGDQATEAHQAASKRRAVFYAKRGFVRYVRRDRVFFGHRTAVVHASTSAFANNVFRMYRVSAGDADMVAITNPGDHLVKVALVSRFFERIGNSSYAGVQATTLGGSNTPWRRFLGLFRDKWGSSDAEWDRKKLFISWFIIHKMFEIRTGTPLPLLLPPCQKVAEQFVQAILDVLELASVVPTFAKHTAEENRLLHALELTPMVLCAFRHSWVKPTASTTEPWRDLMTRAWTDAQAKVKTFDDAKTSTEKTELHKLYVGTTDALLGQSLGTDAAFELDSPGTALLAKLDGRLPDSWYIRDTIHAAFAAKLVGLNEEIVPVVPTNADPYAVITDEVARAATAASADEQAESALRGSVTTLTQAAATYAKKSDFAAYAKTSDLTGLAKVGDLAQFAKATELTQLRAEIFRKLSEIDGKLNKLLGVPTKPTEEPH